MAISSRVVGILRQNAKFDDWWECENALEIPLFNNIYLPVIFMNFEPQFDLTFISEADEALECFLKLGEADKNLISSLAFKNCKAYMNAVGLDEVDARLREIKTEEEIWTFIYPKEIYVSRRRYHDKDVYVQIACECEWEQEHGLQLVFRQGKKLTRVSDQDGHVTEADAYGKPDNEDELLSKF